MKRIAFVTLLCCFVAGWVFAQTDLQPAAIVNLTKSEPITVKQLRTEVERIEKSEGRAATQAERLQVLDTMINERLVLQAAERDRITVAESEVNQQIQQVRASLAQSLGRQQITDAEFAARLREETGLDMAAYREQLRRGLVAQKYLGTKKQSSFADLKPPTEDDILSAYNLAKAQLVRPDTIRFSMIQVDYGPDAASKTRAKEVADRLIREIGTDPAKFDEAVLRGQAPNAGYQAGEGGYLPRNMEAARVVGQDFINTAFSLRQGEVSKLMEGALGYQIIKVTEIYGQKNLELDDIFQVGTRVTVRNYIANGLSQQILNQAVAKATEELVAELRAGRTFQKFENNVRW